MIANMNTNNGKRLFAAIAIFAMLACVFAVAMPVSAEVTEGSQSGEPVDFNAALAAYTGSVPDSPDVTDLGATNAGLGNDITVEYIPDNNTTDDIAGTYVVTGTLNKQTIGYKDGAWTGMNQGDSAKVYYSYNWGYADEKSESYGEYWALIVGTLENATYTNTDDGTTDKSVSNTSMVICLSEDNYDDERYITYDNQKYILDLTGVELSSTPVAAGVIALDKGVTVTLPEGVTATANGTSITVTGTPAAATSEATVENDDFAGIFHGKDDSTVPWGYAFAQINGLETIVGENTATIKQTNSALGWYDGKGDLAVSGITPSGSTWVKEKNTYDSTAVENGYAFLIPQNGGEVTVAISGDGITATTYTFNFRTDAPEFTADASTSADDMNDAMQNGSLVSVVATNANLSKLQVTDAGVKITGTISGSEVAIPVGEYVINAETEEIEWKQTATVTLSNNFSGTIIIAHGSVAIKQAEIDAGGVTITGEKDIILENVNVNNSATITVDAGATIRIGSNVNLNAGTLTITGTGATEENPVKVRLSNNNTLTIEEGAVLKLDAYVQMDAKGTVTGDGQINVTENASLTFSAGMVEVTGDGEIVNNAVTGGTINLNDGTIVDAKSSVLGSATQEIVVSGEVTVVKGGSITVNGQLTIEEGAELILEEGAVLKINSTGKVDLKGTISIEATEDNKVAVMVTDKGSKMNISGTLDIEGNESANIVGTMNVTGIVNIGDGASATLTADSTIAAGGNLNVEGTLEGYVTNAGTITIDSEIAFGSLTVYMMDASTLNLDNIVGSVTVDDSKMQYKDSGKDVDIKNKSSATFQNVSGIIVTDSLTIKNEDLNNDGETERNGYGNLSVSGNADIATNEAGDLDEQAGVIVGITAVSGTLNVAEGATLDLSKYVVLGVNQNAKLVVSGTVTNTDAKEAKDIANNGEITVYGLIQTATDIDTGVVNAAMYEDEDADLFNYTTLAKAIAAGATDIEVTGTIHIDEDVTIPVGTTVDSTKATEVIVDEDVTLTVAADGNNSAKFKNGKVTVDGTMVVQNLRKSGVNEDQVISDVATTDGISATYTNIYKAVADANEGDTVTITKGDDGIVVLDKNLTIPAGVTVEIPDNKEINVDAGVTVTVDGTLSFEDGRYTMDEAPATSTKDDAKTIVNGLLEASNTDEYAKDNDRQIVGAYFAMNGLQCIAPLSYVASVINDIESDVKIIGDVTAQDVAFNYTADEGFDIVVDAGNSLTAGTITLSGIDLEFNGKVNATVAVADGSFVLKDVTGGIISDVSTFDANNNEVHTATLTGTNIANAMSDDTTPKELDGKITANGTVAIGKADINVDFTVAEGATVTVTDAVEFDDKVVIYGDLVADASGINLNNVTVVYGTISVEEDADVTAKNKVYIGFDIDTEKNGGFVIDIATGSMTGVKLDTAIGVVYATPGSTFTPIQAQSEDMLSTEYYIEDALWMTAYTVNKSMSIESLRAQIDNAEFVEWQNAEETPIKTDAGQTTGAVIGNEDFQQVYADINYDIYMVFVTADEGIGTVYIDGKVMTKYSNTFMLIENGEPVQLAAGEHTISFVLKNSFDGDVTMYVNGTAVSGYTFTLEGNLENNATTVNYTINLVGVEPTAPVTPSGDSGSDGMGLTDYLLIILVILIVVMAIMVAMRLMRS